MDKSQLDKSVLIVDDDEEFCEEIATFLSRYLFDVIVVHKPVDAEPILKSGDVGVLLLDVMLPGKHGLEFCKEVRESMKDLPILFVSAYCDTVEQILGFEAGADDFLHKPFLPQELLARMKAILRRSRAIPEGKPNAEIRTRQGLRVNTVHCQVWLNEERVRMPTFQYELLLYFLQNPQRLIPRAEIMEKVHLYNADILSRSVDINVSRIRKALNERPDDPKFIRTVWRKGYYFLDEVIAEDI